jgi:hypothetical protein
MHLRCHLGDVVHVDERRACGWRRRLVNREPRAWRADTRSSLINHVWIICHLSSPVIVGNSIRLASGVESGDALG